MVLETTHALTVLCVDIGTGSPAAKKWKAKEDKAAELHFGLILPLKNHEDGLKAFSYAVNTYASKPAPKHFAEALSNVIADKQHEPPSTYYTCMEGLWHSETIDFHEESCTDNNGVDTEICGWQALQMYMQVCFFFDLAIG